MTVISEWLLNNVCERHDAFDEFYKLSQVISQKKNSDWLNEEWLMFAI